MAKAGGRGGAKKFAGTAAIAGLLAGVLLYGAIKDPLLRAEVIASNQKPLTLHGVLGLPYAAVALAWGALFVLVALARRPAHAGEDLRAGPPRAAAGSTRFAASGAGSRRARSPALLVFLASAQGGYLGFSGALLAVTGWGAHLVGHPLEVVPRINDDIVWRAALIIGVFPGALLAAAFSLRSRAAAEAPAPKVLDGGAIGRSFGAATVMSLGALIGGGCTTGAFIAAWPTLSLGSLAMAGTFFVVSMAVANGRLLARSLDLGAAQAAGDRVYD